MNCKVKILVFLILTVIYIGFPFYITINYKFFDFIHKILFYILYYIGFFYPYIILSIPFLIENKKEEKKEIDDEDWD